LNPVVWNALDVAIGMAEEDGEARVVLLRGEGGIVFAPAWT